MHGIVLIKIQSLCSVVYKLCGQVAILTKVFERHVDDIIFFVGALLEIQLSACVLVGRFTSQLKCYKRCWNFFPPRQLNPSSAESNELDLHFLTHRQSLGSSSKFRWFWIFLLPLLLSVVKWKQCTAILFNSNVFVLSRSLGYSL